MEVLISPIVEACPTKNKAGFMSLLHSFYCWGHLVCVVISTAKNHFSVRTTAMELGTMNRLYRHQIEKQVHRYLPRIFPSTLKGNTRIGKCL